jgi:hypothetical protein
MIIVPFFQYININDESITLFNNYYVTNKYKSLITDFFLICIYLKISEIIPYSSNIPITFKRLLIILIIDIIINYYIINTPYQTDYIIFLNTWVRTVGWYAIIWDIIYILSTGYIADEINKNEYMQNENIQLITYIIMGILLIHC